MFFFFSFFSNLTPIFLWPFILHFDLKLLRTKIDQTIFLTSNRFYIEFSEPLWNSIYDTTFAYVPTSKLGHFRIPFTFHTPLKLSQSRYSRSITVSNDIFFFNTFDASSSKFVHFPLTIYFPSNYTNQTLYSLSPQSQFNYNNSTLRNSDLELLQTPCGILYTARPSQEAGWTRIWQGDGLLRYA